jgi:hypothetical protein
MIYSAQDVIVVDVSTADFVLAKEAYAIRTAGAGNIVLITRANKSVTLAFAAGETRYIYATKFIKIGTTATGIEALLPPT